MTESALRDQLRRTVPRTHLPRYCVVLPVMPLTDGGKADRRVLRAMLPAPAPAGPQAQLVPGQPGHERPGHERPVHERPVHEETLRAFRAALGRPDLAGGAHFLEAGGELTWSVTGRKPLVIRAEALVGEPAAVVRAYCEAVGLPYLPGALSWQPSDRPEWQRHRAWHLDAIASAGFEDRKHAYPVNVDNNDTLKAFYRYHYPFYRSIVQHAIGTGASMTADTFSPPSGAGAAAATGPSTQGAAPAGSGMAPSPGTVFARAFAADGERTEVTFDYTITDAHKPAREKPRLTVRSLLKKRPVDADVITF